MSFRNISAWCIRNPVPPIVLFALLLMAGLVSFNRMDVNDNPDVEFPAVQVIVVQPGAAPTELETQVTQRVEAAIRGVSGVDEMSSYVSEGNSRTFVQFAIGTPIDRAYNDVNQAIQQIRSRKWHVRDHPPEIGEGKFGMHLLVPGHFVFEIGEGQCVALAAPPRFGNQLLGGKPDLPHSVARRG